MAANAPKTIVVIHGVRNFGMHGRSPLGQQSVLRHGVEDARLAEQHHQHHRGEAEDGADLHQQRSPAHPGRVDCESHRSRHVQRLVAHQAGQNQRDQDVKNGADHQRSENADRHIALADSSLPAPPSRPRRSRYRRRRWMPPPWEFRPSRSCRARPAAARRDASSRLATSGCLNRNQPPITRKMQTMVTLMITTAELKLADSLMPITRMVGDHHDDAHRNQVEDARRVRQARIAHARGQRHQLQPLIVIEDQRRSRWWP